MVSRFKHLGFIGTLTGGLDLLWSDGFAGLHMWSCGLLPRRGHLLLIRASKKRA